MILFSVRDHVSKAKRKPWKRTRTPHRLEALHQSMSGAVRVDLVRGLKTFKNRIDPEEVYRAWLSGDYWKTMDIIPWQELPGDLGKATEKLGETLGKASGFTIESLPPPVEDKLRFDMHNPRIRRYAERVSGKLVVNIEEDTRKFIASAVARKFDAAMTPRRVADIIRPQIGLLPRQTTALQNYRTMLEREGTGTKRLEKLVDDYHDKMLDSRSMTIARTETRMAENQGQQAVWDQAANQGLISREARRRWLVDGAPCEVCEPMDGEEVGLFEPWTIEYPDGSTENVMVPTESHPNCMCQMELVAESLGEAAEGGE
jgi:hypothetical protein